MVQALVQEVAGNVGPKVLIKAQIQQGKITWVHRRVGD